MTHEENAHGGTAHGATGHVTVGKYMIGFVLAVVLTLISFGIVAAGVQPTYAAVIALVAAAVIQMLVHLYYFLHLEPTRENQWNFISIVFTAIMLLIFILGTVWVIFTLNSRMM